MVCTVRSWVSATSLVGAQTIIYTNATQHNVNGTIYNDTPVSLLLDEAGVSTANFNWYFDQYNNLIGATEIAAATSYGVITSIWWAGNTTRRLWPGQCHRHLYGRHHRYRNLEQHDCEHCQCRQSVCCCHRPSSPDSIATTDIMKRKQLH